ncbi:MAG: ribosome-associated translation inhibitor RaiA [Candidatus Omnitrophica bacterium]|nr:ribosome-associated translation inhibitor RaiA [Candidatus Omnitrophota bacterium]
MKITVTARHVELPDWVQELLKSKVEKLERFGHTLLQAHAIFGREKYLYTAELTLSTKGANLVGKAKHATDLLTCMEEALSKLERQLKRLQEKRMGLARRRVTHRPA